MAPKTLRQQAAISSSATPLQALQQATTRCFFNNSLTEAEFEARRADLNAHRSPNTTMVSVKISLTQLAILIDIFIGLPLAYLSTLLVCWLPFLNNSVCKIIVMVAVNLVFIALLSSSVMLATNIAEDKVKRERELAWWDVEARRLEDIRLQWKAKKEDAGEDV